MGLGLNSQAQIYAATAYMYINKGIGRRLFRVMGCKMQLTSIGQGFLNGGDTNDPMEIRSLLIRISVLSPASWVVGTHTCGSSNLGTVH